MSYGYFTFFNVVLNGSKCLHQLLTTDNKHCVLMDVMSVNFVDGNC